MEKALNLGSVWINKLRWINETKVILEKMQELGMADDERVYGSLTLGYDDTEDGMPIRTPLDRTGNIVTIVK